jgi:hypothetical protein
MEVVMLSIYLALLAVIHTTKILLDRFDKNDQRRYRLTLMIEISVVIVYVGAFTGEMLLA